MVQCMHALYNSEMGVDSKMYSIQKLVDLLQLTDINFSSY